jgi:hypothetical protein
MSIRTIEIPCYAGLDIAHMLDAAIAVARPFGAHVDATCVVPDAAAELAMLPPLTVGADALALPAFERVIEESRARQKVSFESWCDTHGIGHQAVGHRLDSIFACWREERGSIEAVVMKRGRLADLTIVQRPGTGDVGAARCFDAAVFATGRAAMMVPEKLPTHLLSHVVVAWNGSLEATRAVALSLPMLHEADAVSIFAAPRPGEGNEAELDLAASLRWHGIEARLLHHPEPGEPVGKALVAAIRDGAPRTTCRSARSICSTIRCCASR